MKPYHIIVYVDQNEVRVFCGDIGTINNVRMIKQDGEIYMNMNDLAEMMCLKEEADELLNIYTYRSIP